MPTKARYLSAKDAAEQLGITLPTLYAYVSRGLIRSEPLDDTRRTRRYLAEDVQKLIDRREQREDPSKAAQAALHWGTPVMDSAITLIEDGRLYYRGYDATQLAVERSFEDVALLLWTGELDSGKQFFSEAVPSPSAIETVATLWQANPALSFVQAFQTALALAAAEDLAAYDLRTESVMRTGVRIIPLLAAVSGNHVRQQHDGADERSIAQRLAQGWGLDESAVPLLNAALILCADHEFNVSAFTARAVASSEASPYAVVTGGLAALQGFKHGGHTERVEAMMRVLQSSADVRPFVAEKLRLGEGISGFGHRLYPDADPRTVVLLALLRVYAPESPVLAVVDELTQVMAELVGKPPVIDLALVALTQALGLPRGSALALFAIGRTAGWIGHALEQYETRQLIRPRARYTGVPPRDSTN
ncbi:MAG: citrate synthase family protein [bacterium]|nr:citrate synthase family protein [bacterium]